MKKLKEIQKISFQKLDANAKSLRNPILRGDYKIDYTELEKYSASKSVQETMQEYMRKAIDQSLVDQYYDAIIQPRPRKLPSTYQTHQTFHQPEPVYMKRLSDYKNKLAAALSKREAVIAERSYDRYRDSGLIAMGFGIVIAILLAL
jgi:hypothetical protein